MNIIKKTFLHSLAALFLAIGASCLVTGGINLAQSNSNLGSNVTIVVAGIVLLMIFMVIEMGITIYEVSLTNDGG
ncbi:hypothetical protein [Vibrio sp. 10N]|uniref:hypothetical protein n=1 Tax=Vibrio sp. 10N TaxID=3058938 RepID=UPI002813DCB1|nr:hypothetical protein VB10N_46400 [Vibrio sp. 10N]